MQPPHVPIRAISKTSSSASVVPYHIEHAPSYAYSRTPRKEDSGLLEKREPFYAKFISIRVVLVFITITSVLTMGVGLIYLSVQAQYSIIDTLSNQVTDQVVTDITSQNAKLIGWAESELNASLLMFKLHPNLTNAPIGKNPFEAPGYDYLSEYMWSVVRKHPVGITMEIDFLDGRFFGVEAFDGVGNLYWADTINGSNFEVIWPASIDQKVASVNKSAANVIVSFPCTVNPDIFVPNRPYLNTCEDPLKWFDMWVFMNYYMITSYHTVCNDQGAMIGWVSLSLGLLSLTDVLRKATDEVIGKIFIMDGKHQLVASSTGSKIFKTFPDYSSIRYNITNTEERWILDVVGALDGKYGVGRRSVHINGTDYYLTVTRWNDVPGMDWYYVMLLEQDQFLGSSRSYFAKSVIAATLIAAATVAVVSIVTWITTKPLFILARDLKKMSQLDLEVSDMETPRLFEVGKLYKSVASMYIALRSFKKYVPVQVISKIIKSEKEATAELSQSNVTIMFQDIEGFTTLSEAMDPVTLAKLTSEYMETMTEIICRHGGTIDKYIGDCIMSLFNAPDKLANHPLAATTAAAECMKTLAKKNTEWKTKYGCQMNARIGINTGDVLIGNMGSDYRMNYTAFGDNVNVAARLEGVNKFYGTRITVSKAVHKSFAQDAPFLTRKLSKVRVSGKAKPTAIYEIRPKDSMNTLDLFRDEAALKCFKKKEFANAMDRINEALAFDASDTASLELKERIEVTMRIYPLPEDWSYIQDLTK